MKLKFVLFPLLVFGGVSTILAEQLPQLEKVPPSCSSLSHPGLLQ
jgi:hypothetical protein